METSCIPVRITPFQSFFVVVVVQIKPVRGAASECDGSQVIT
jgi:hypothetical protein